MCKHYAWKYKCGCLAVSRGAHETCDNEGDDEGDDEGSTEGCPKGITLTRNNMRSMEHEVEYCPKYYDQRRADVFNSVTQDGPHPVCERLVYDRGFEAGHRAAFLKVFEGFNHHARKPFVEFVDHCFDDAQGMADIFRKSLLKARFEDEPQLQTRQNVRSEDRPSTPGAPMLDDPSEPPDNSPYIATNRPLESDQTEDEDANHQDSRSNPALDDSSNDSHNDSVDDTSSIQPKKQTKRQASRNVPNSSGKLSSSRTSISKKPKRRASRNVPKPKGKACSSRASTKQQPINRVTRTERTHPARARRPPIRLDQSRNQ